MWKPKEGENCVRILKDTWEDVDTWGDNWDIQVFVHFSVGPDNAAYLCLDKMKGEICPVCEMWRRTTNEEEKRALRPSERRLVWVIDRNNEKAGPQVWSQAPTLFKDIVGRSVDKKTNTLIKIDDLAKGYDVIFIREGTQLNTKYSQVEVLREATPIHNDPNRAQRWKRYIEDNPLPDVLEYYDAAYIKKIMFGQGVADEEEEERPRRPRTPIRDADEAVAPPPRPRPKAEPEELPEEEETELPDGEETEEVGDDNEEEEAAASVRGRGPKPGRSATARNGDGEDGPPWGDEEDQGQARRKPPVPATPAPKPTGARLSGLRHRR
jgi:hypothetical protein